MLRFFIKFIRQKPVFSLAKLNKSYETVHAYRTLLKRHIANHMLKIAVSTSAIKQSNWPRKYWIRESIQAGGESDGKSGPHTVVHYWKSVTQIKSQMLLSI